MSQLRYRSGFDPLDEADRDRLHPDALPFFLPPLGETARSASRGATAIAAKGAGDGGAADPAAGRCSGGDAISFGDAARARAPERGPETDGIVVCLHGFTAMPYGVRPVAAAIAARGLAAVAPLQPGHGFADRRDQRRGFSELRGPALLDAARTEVARARDRYGFVGVYGDSMGGAIALALAAEGLVDACAATAPALRLPFRGEVLCALLGWTDIALPKAQSKRFYNPCYGFESARAGAALLAVSRYARQRLESVRCPCFAVHSHNDRVIPAIATEWVRDRVAGPVEVQWFDESGHVMPLDVCGDRISTAIGEFFARQAAEMAIAPKR